MIQITRTDSFWETILGSMIFKSTYPVCVSKSFSRSPELEDGTGLSNV